MNKSPPPRKQSFTSQIVENQNQYDSLPWNTDNGIPLYASESSEADSQPKEPRFQLIAYRIMPPLTVLGTLLSLMVVVVLYSFVYLGCLWDPSSRLSKVPLAFINQDAGFNFTDAQVQDRVQRITKNETLGTAIDPLKNENVLNLFDWQRFDASMPISELRDRVDDGEFWGYLLIPKDFSNAFLTNINPNSTIQPLMLEYYFDQARQYTVTGLISAAIKATVSEVSLSFGKALIEESQIAGSLLVKPSFLLQPVHLNIVNAHPVYWFGINFASYVCSIVLCIAGMAIITTMLKITQQRFELVRLQMGRRWFSIRMLAIYHSMIFFYTLFISIILVGMLTLLNGDTSFVSGGHNIGQVILFLWASAMAYTSIIALLAMVLKFEFLSLFGSLFLIVQLVTSTAILDPVVMPAFTKLGYGLPMHYSIKGLKCLFLNSQCSNFQNDAFVILGWWIGSFILISILMTYRLHKMVIAFKNE